MLAAADRPNHFVEQPTYESQWTEDNNREISWLNLLTAQPIPEENDNDSESIRTPTLSKSSSMCSSSSVDSCYFVLEIQRPHPPDEQPVIESEEEEEEEEEIIEEQVLNFARLNSEHHVYEEYDQLPISMTTEIPTEEYAIEHQISGVEEYAQVTEVKIEQPPNDLLFRKAKTLSKFTKRIKATAHVPFSTRISSSSEEEESICITKLKTIRKINEYRPINISTVTAKHHQTVQSSIHHSTTSLDSIEKKQSATSPSARTKMTTTFSRLSTQRVSNSTQHQQHRPTTTMGTTTLTRTFAFDRACMEKYGIEQDEQKIEIPSVPEKTIETTPSFCEKIEDEIANSNEKSPPDDTLNCRSFTNTIPNPFYLSSCVSVTDDTEFEPPITQQIRSTPTTHSLSKASAFLRLMKKPGRAVTSEYRLTNNGAIGETIRGEPTLLQVKYFDGGRVLTDNDARQSLHRAQTLSGSVASRLNRFGLTLLSSTQDLSSPTTPYNSSCRRRLLNRFRTFVEVNPPDPQSSIPIPQSRPWQHKTIIELFNERKTKADRY